MIEITDIEHWRLKQNLSKADVARMFDIVPQRYNNWVYRGSIPKEYYQRAAELLHSSEPNTASLLRPVNKVPLIAWVNAGLWCESPDIFSPGDAEEWLACPSRHSQKTYALRVIGDSMTSQSPGERGYPQGTIIFVDPEKPVEVGSKVIARLPNTSEVTFKVYVVDAGVSYLMPINTRYPAMKMPDETHICGVVIGSYWPE